MCLDAGLVTPCDVNVAVAATATLTYERDVLRYLSDRSLPKSIDQAFGQVCLAVHF